MSLLWRTASLTEEQHDALAQVRALPGEPDRPNMASGQPVKDLMARHNITWHPSSPSDWEIYPEHHHDRLAVHEPEDELHTSQQHLWKPALEQYIREGHTHLHDPDYGDEDPLAYHPETHEVGDRTWVAEGHHRILARRMLGESVEARHASSRDDPEADYEEPL